jgi:hypothetical protein
MFSRGLDARFEEALGGPLNLLLRLTREERLDLQIRKNYINVYEGRGSVLKLEWLRGDRLRATVHAEYDPPTWLEHAFELCDAETWIQRFSGALPGIRKSAQRHDKPEGAVEFNLTRANNAPPLVVIDRQVQLHGQRDSRIDMVALSCGANHPPSIVFIELKEGRNLAPSAVLDQVERYDRTYVSQGRLREDVATSLYRVLIQKNRLGLLAAIPGIDGFGHLAVEHLVVFSSRAAPIALKENWRRKAPPIVHYVGLGAGDHSIPDRSLWEILRGTDDG